MSHIQKWDQVLLFKQLEQSAKVTQNQKDSNQTWNYPDRLSADRLSLLLQKVGISEPSAARKTIAMERDGTFSLVITKSDLVTIENKYTFYFSVYRAERENQSSRSDSAPSKPDFSEQDAKSLRDAEEEIDEELAQHKYGPTFGALNLTGITLASSPLDF